MLSKLEVKSAISLYKQGWSLREIGEEFKTSHETIRTDLKRAGFKDFRPRGSEGGDRLDINLDYILEAYQERKLNLSEIAREVGCSTVAIKSRFDELGIDYERPGFVTRYYDVKEIKRLYWKEKLGVFSIAQIVGGSGMTVMRFMKANGIATRPPETPRRLFVPAATLKKQYLKDKLSTYKLSKLYGVSPSTIRNKLIRIGVTLRPRNHK